MLIGIILHLEKIDLYSQERTVYELTGTLNGTINHSRIGSLTIGKTGKLTVVENIEPGEFFVKILILITISKVVQLVFCSVVNVFVTL